MGFKILDIQDSLLHNDDARTITTLNQSVGIKKTLDVHNWKKYCIQEESNEWKTYIQ